MLNYKFICGDGRKFLTLTRALEHAKKVCTKTGAFISVEAL